HLAGLLQQEVQVPCRWNRAIIRVLLLPLGSKRVQRAGREATQRLSTKKEKSGVREEGFSNATLSPCFLRKAASAVVRPDWKHSFPSRSRQLTMDPEQGRTQAQTQGGVRQAEKGKRCKNSRARTF